MELVYIFYAIFCYFFVGSFISGAMKHIIGRNEPILLVISGIIWPIVLPVLLLIMGNKLGFTLAGALTKDKK